MSRNRGSILLLVLWVLAVLSSAAVAQAIRFSLQVKWAGRLDETRQSWHLAWTAVEIAGQELVLDADPAWDAPKESWARVPAEPTSLPAGRLQYRIQDEQSRIPLNRLPVEMIALLPGFNPLAAAELIERRGKGKQVVHLGELLLLPDFRKEDLPALAELVTVYGTGPVNLNTAPEPVLIRLGLSASLAGQVAVFRLGQDGIWGTKDDGVFTDVEEILPLLEDHFGPLLPQDQTTLGNLISAQLLGVRSSFFQVEAEGWIQDPGIHTRTLAVMERTGPNARPILRGWREIF